jgi:hypothetical protein
MSESFDWLQRFFLSNCDGEWEHEYGCKIDTMSDPGWILKFDLTGTPFETKLLEPLEDKASPTVWLKCRAEDGVFVAQCSPRRLAECIDILRDVVEGRRGHERPAQLSDE